MKRKTVLNEIVKRYALPSLVIAAVIAFVCSSLFIAHNPEPPYPELWKKLLAHYRIFLLSFCTIPVGAVFVFATFRAIESNTLRTTAHRLGLAINRRWLVKNAAYINAYLLEFLYAVLRANNETLHLPLGQDASALIPNGFSVIPRAGCVFYRYQLVLPEVPEMDKRSFHQIIQQYIWAELCNHGIAGLNASFPSKTHGRLPSVFLDKVWYDGEQHSMNFEVLYICTEDAGQYAMQAFQKRKPKTQPNQEVFDDELR